MPETNTVLPHETDQIFLTDGGIETWLIFKKGFDLPHFAAFEVLNSEAGRTTLIDYYQGFLKLAKQHGLGFVLESPTWRANADWGEKLGHSAAALARINNDAISFLRDLQASADTGGPVILSGCIGPRGDGYDPGQVMTIEEARAYHAAQIGAFKRAQADMITAITMTDTAEAIGLTEAAKAAGIPVVIAFTVETDGDLPTGQSLSEAISEVDGATDQGPAYYMINCAHPSHFERLFKEQGGDWKHRIRGIRANASRLSHAELDEAEVLDDGDPNEFGALHQQLKTHLPWLNVIGGCCGTDHRHVEQVCIHCTA